MQRRQAILLAGNGLAVAVIAVAIEAAGGLPGQLVHFYYIPVVVAALFLPLRYSLAIALLAGLAVSPFGDVVRHLAGREAYFADPAPWNLHATGWIVRPLAFVAISVLGFVVTREHEARLAAQAARDANLGELAVLGRIDKMILGGADEEEALREIAQLVQDATGADQAGVVLPADASGRMRVVLGQNARPETVAAVAEGLPAGEGVSGWALLHGKLATSADVFHDPRYDQMQSIARLAGSAAVAAAPVVLDGEILAAISVTFDGPRVFSDDELATLSRVADQASIAVANARQRESLRRLSFETAIGLAEAIEGRDPYTGDHCSRLAGYAAHVAAMFGHGAREIDVIRLGAALHDIGKIVVPDQILKKPDRLTPAEYAIIKQHCYQGGQICKRITALADAYPIVYHHHERWDGHGYPDGLQGERIPFGARIVAVVDAYDAMVSDRPYRQAMAEEEARAILRDGAGAQWDPTIVEKFLALRWEFEGTANRMRAA